MRTPLAEAARGDGCGTGRRRHGGRRARRIPPPWLPPTFLLRQGLSLAVLAALTGWTRLPFWIVRYGLKCIPGAAGAVGMGCIGFPNHPVWEETTECNQECRHCHVSAGRPLPRELDPEQGRRLIDELAAVRAFRMLAYTGGEPLLRKDLFDLLARSSERGFTNTLATKATLVDRSVARDLRRRGVAIAAVSLDGADPDTHDRGRGRSLDGEAFGREANERLMTFLAEAQRKSSAVLEPVAGPQYWAYLLSRAGISGGRSFSEQCGGCAYARVCGGCRGRAYARCENFAAEDPGCFIQSPARQSPFMEVQDAN